MSRNLIAFCIAAQMEIKQTPNLDAMIKRFIEFRYDIMSRLFPHGVFSSEQAHLNFFEQTIKHLEGEPLPKGEGGKKLSEFAENYNEWIRKYKTV